MILNDLKDKVISTINESKLPIDAVYYVMKDIMTEIAVAYSQAIEEEKKNETAEEEQKEEAE